jgi:hypothetical protein
MRISGLMVTAALALTACGGDECDGAVCPAGFPTAVNATVVDATGLSLSDVSVQVVEPAGLDGFCSPSVAGNTAWTCSVGSGPGRYVIDVIAAGHVAQRLEFTSRSIPGCCPRHEIFTGTVTLQRTLAAGSR